MDIGQDIEKDVELLAVAFEMMDHHHAMAEAQKTDPDCLSHLLNLQNVFFEELLTLVSWQSRSSDNSKLFCRTPPMGTLASGKARGANAGRIHQLARGSCEPKRPIRKRGRGRAFPGRTSGQKSIGTVHTAHLHLEPTFMPSTTAKSTKIFTKLGQHKKQGPPWRGLFRIVH